MEWYALHVRTRFEKYVQNHLEDKGYDVFLPTYVTKRQWSDRVKSLSLPLFPSYVFCRFDVHERLPILMTPGVNFIVGAGKSHTPVEEKEISAIRQVLDSGIATTPWPYLKVGEQVQIEAGPLEGLTGLVVRMKDECRLVVSVSLLMRSVSVELDRRWIKPLTSASAATELVFQDTLSV